MFGWDKKSRLNKKITAAVREGNIRLTGELLAAGADIEAREGGAFDMPLLGLAAYKGHIEVLKLLLDKGADMQGRDRDGDMPVANAVNGNHADALSELLARGADKSGMNNKGQTAADIALKYDRKNLLALLGVALREEPAASKAPEEKPAPAKIEPVRAESADEVVFFRPHGNRLLEETFNFAAKERITLLRNGIDGPVEAMTRDSFELLGDKAALRHAFEIYQSRGGKLAEAEIFPDALGKKPLPGRQP